MSTASTSPTGTRAVAQSSAGATLRIGVVANLGPDRDTASREQLEAIALAVETINAAGGVPLAGGAARPIELVVYDDDGDPERTGPCVRNLAREERVLAIVGASSRESAAEVIRAAESTQTPHLALVAPSGESSTSARWTFSLALGPDGTMAALADFLVGRRVDRLGWIAPRTASAAEARAALARRTAAGVDLIAEETYSPSDDDLAEPVARLLAAGAQHVVGWPRDARDAALLARAAAARGFRERLYLGPPAATDSYLVLAGDAAAGTRTLASRLAVADDLWDHDPLTPPVRDFVRAFRLRHDYPPTSAGAAGWDAVRLLAAAIERVGDDRAALRSALEAGPPTYGASGRMSFDAADHDGLGPDSLLVVRVVTAGWRLPP